GAVTDSNRARTDVPKFYPRTKNPGTLSPKSGEKRYERPEVTPHDEKPMTATTTKTKQKETTIMKTKLVKRIASCSLFACALASLIATVPLGTSATAGPAPARVC